MSNSTRNKANFKNLHVDGSNVNVGRVSSTPHASMKVKSEAFIPQMEDVRFSSLTIPITDTGGVGGGYAALGMLVLPSTRCLILGAFLDFTVASVAAGLTNGTYTVSVGTAATANSTLDGSEVDVIASTNLTISSGAGTAEAVTSIVMIHVDATTAKTLYLNIGVPDASISATSSLVASGVFRLFYIDLSDGE